MGELGSLIKAIRETHQLSLNQLGRAIDIDPAYLSRIENGKVRASVGAVKAIADTLGVPRSKLLEAAGHVEFNTDSIDEIELFKLAIDKGKIDIRHTVDSSRQHIADYIKTGRQQKPYIRPRLSSNLIMNKVNRIHRGAKTLIGWNGEPPFPIRKFAEVYCKLLIKEEFFQSARERARLIPQSRTILINSVKCGTDDLKRYAIAHEVGHWFVKVFDTFIFDPAEGTASYKSIEADANSLGSSLIMPSTSIKELAKQFSLYDPIHRLALAKIFGVSLMAMEFRLIKLTLVPRQKVLQDSAIERFSREQSLKLNPHLCWMVDSYQNQPN